MTAGSDADPCPSLLGGARLGVDVVERTGIILPREGKVVPRGAASGGGINPAGGEVQRPILPGSRRGIFPLRGRTGVRVRRFQPDRLRRIETIGLSSPERSGTDGSAC